MITINQLSKKPGAVQLEAERAAHAHEVVLTELRRLNARLNPDERGRPVEVPRARTLR